MILAWMGTCAVSPLVGLYLLMGRLFGFEQVFAAQSQLLSLVPGRLGVIARRSYFRLTLAECSPECWVEFGTILSHPGTTVGTGVYIGCYCTLGRITIEDDVLIASHVSITNGRHQHGIVRLDAPIRSQPGVFEDVRIGCDSWVGERSVVMANVGRHCVVAAGSVVISDVPDYAIVAGVPARIIGDRREQAGKSETAGAVCHPNKRVAE